MAVSKGIRPLTEQQRRYARGIAKGFTKEEAYKEAGYKGDPQCCAHSVHVNPRIQDFIKELSEKADDDTIITVRERKEYLTKAIREGEYIDPAKAMDILNKMDGAYKPDETEGKTKIIVKIGGSV